MSDPNSPCLACQVVEGAHRPAGGVLWRGEGMVVHGFTDPVPIRGWVVVTSARHVRGLYDLDEAEARALGAVAARVMGLQRRLLGAEHVYALALGDVLRHFHLHLVPRYADTPDRLRGRKCLDGQPGDFLAPEPIEDACRQLAEALTG